MPEPTDLLVRRGWDAEAKGIEVNADNLASRLREFIALRTALQNYMRGTWFALPEVRELAEYQPDFR